MSAFLTFEAIAMAALCEVALVLMAFLFMRLTGRRIPAWTGLGWLNRYIEPRDRMEMVLRAIRAS